MVGVGHVKGEQRVYLAQGAENHRAALRLKRGPAGEADAVGVRAQVHADEHQVQDVGHAGPGIRLLLQQRGHQCLEVPAVAGRNGRKPPAAGMQRSEWRAATRTDSRLHLAVERSGTSPRRKVMHLRRIAGAEGATSGSTEQSFPLKGALGPMQV